MPLKYPRELLKDSGLLVDVQGLLIEGRGLPRKDLGLIWLRYIVLTYWVEYCCFCSYATTDHYICLMCVYWLSTFCFIAF